MYETDIRVLSDRLTYVVLHRVRLYCDTPITYYLSTIKMWLSKASTAKKIFTSLFLPGHHLLWANSNMYGSHVYPSRQTVLQTISKMVLKCQHPLCLCPMLDNSRDILYSTVRAVHGGQMTVCRNGLFPLPVDSWSVWHLVYQYRQQGSCVIICNRKTCRPCTQLVCAIKCCPGRQV